MSVSKTESKNIRALHSRKGRQAAGLFLAEGVRLIEEAHKHDRMPEKLYVVPELLNERGNRLLKRFAEKSISITEITERELSNISDTRTPQPVFGIFSLPSTELKQPFEHNHRKVILCDSVSDPGNIGTIIRSAAAFGFTLLITVGSCADPYSPKVVRSTAGAIFSVEVVCEKADRAVQALKSGGFEILAATVTNGEKVTEQAMKIADKRLVLAIGSEESGLSDQILDYSDTRIQISHSSAVESLNAAVAGSIIMSMIFTAENSRP